jgi:hypothetical protein
MLRVGSSERNEKKKREKHRQDRDCTEKETLNGKRESRSQKYRGED